MIRTCPICIISKPKRLKKNCGSVRSNIYLPGEALETDSLYLPRDRYGNSKTLIMVDVASSKTSVFPGANL